MLMFHCIAEILEAELERVVYSFFESILAFISSISTIIFDFAK